MGLGSIAAGVASSLIGAGMSSAQGYLSQRSQYNFGKKETIHRPSWEVEGLKRAGLNPILAATGGWRGSSSGVSGFAPNPSDVARSVEALSSSSAKSTQSDVNEELEELTSAKAEIEKMRKDWEQIKFDYMKKNQDVLLPVAASSEAGYTPHSAKDAALTSAVLSTNNKIVDREIKKSANNKNLYKGGKSGGKGASGGW